MRQRLAGRVVATTREEDGDDLLGASLRAEGAHVRTWATRVFGEPTDPKPLMAALAHLEDYDWLAFTSPRAVSRSVQACRWETRFGRVAAVGEATARALRTAGWPVHVQSEGGGAVGLAEAIADAGDVEGARVLFLAGSLARPDLERALCGLGARVDRVEAYRTVVTPPEGAEVREDLTRGVSAVLFASPSAVEGLSAALGGALGPSLGRTVVVAIGPTTAAALAERGVSGVAVAEKPSMRGLVESCVKALNHNREDTKMGSPSDNQTSEALLERARRVIPGGVNSPVRAFKGVGGVPRFIRAAEGGFLEDVDGRRLLDFIGSWGVMVLGHNHPAPCRALTEALASGTSFGAPTEGEIEWAETVTRLVPGVEMVRMVNSGTEATMSAIRLARAATGRSRVIKFRGGYHGHGDAFLVEAGSGAATLGVPSSPGVPPGTAADSLVAEYNDLGTVEALFAAHPGEIAAVIVEPVSGNMGCVPPVNGFLSGLQELCHGRGALLIFDEVMTGFRVARGGAQERYGVTPDLTTLGKVIGGGLPVGAYGGRTDLMRMMAPEGPVYQAGTLSGNPLAVAAGLATLRFLEEEDGVYAHLEALGRQLDEGFAELGARLGMPLRWNRVGGMGSLFFTDAAVTDWPSVAASSKTRFAALFHGLLDEGIHLPPSPFEAWFWSYAHTADDMERTLRAMEGILTGKAFPHA